MSQQLNIFDQTGEQLRDKGMAQAVKHANQKCESWSEKAYNFLVEFCNEHDEFMTEDVRKASEEVVPIPPSTRAWGAIIVKAAKSGLIRRIGFQNVKNAKAHSTPASVWQVK